MMEDIYELLKSLCEIPGPVGRETLVQDSIKKHLLPFCSEIDQDKIGNLMATMEGTSRHYAIVAHADEVGFLVSCIDENGFLRAKWNTQGYMPDLRLLPGQRVLIMTDSGMVPGCFSVKTAHIAGPEGKKKIPSWEEVFIDVGARSSDDVSGLGINIGDPVVYDTETKRVGKNIVGKTFDDRVGLAVIVKVAERLSEVPKKDRPTVTFVSSVLEEVGAKGVAAIANKLDVDGVIVAEVGLADDYPGTKGEAGVSLGKGPVVVVKDSQIVYSHEQNSSLIITAEANEIRIQRAVYHNYATDGFQIASHGQIVSVVAVPCRYTHSSFEAIDISDVESTISLISQFLLDSK
ncbi:MAG: M20/M25/M40 family metallo-hydrolase [Candidatus Thorarchaeota archaeon]|nr:MAG: M20/M25/M40 family metallo-hydrolase [Candidatus Thorarchaeota archaeon]